MAERLRIDEIGYWPEVKLDIIREYAAAYSSILTAQTRPPICHVYVDAFAGAGVHLSKRSGRFIRGSPLNALIIDPPFHSYHLIDIDGRKASLLRSLTAEYANVHIYEGDSNSILLDRIFPEI